MIGAGAHEICPNVDRRSELEVHDVRSRNDGYWCRNKIHVIHVSSRPVTTNGYTWKCAGIHTIEITALLANFST